MIIQLKPETEGKVEVETKDRGKALAAELVRIVCDKFEVTLNSLSSSRSQGDEGLEYWCVPGYEAPNFEHRIVRNCVLDPDQPSTLSTTSPCPMTVNVER